MRLILLLQKSAVLVIQCSIRIINIEKEAHDTVANMLTLSLMFLVAEHVRSPGPTSDPGSDQSSG